MKNLTFIFKIVCLSLIPGLNVTGQECEPVNLGNDTLICEGNALYLDAGPGNEYLWQDQSTERYYVVTMPGEYYVMVLNECGEVSNDTIQVDLAESPYFSFVYPELDYYCKGEVVDLMVELENTTSSVTYVWRNEDTKDKLIEVDTTGIYAVTVTNEFGCQVTKEVNLEFQYPYEEEKILLASYDPELKRNILIYSRTEGKRTDSLIIYRGNTDENRYRDESFNAINLVIDELSDPNSEAVYYNLQVKDSCGNYSRLDPVKAHKTMHLDVNINENGQGLLSFNPYVGFDYEYCYIDRGTDPDNLSVYDSIRVSTTDDKMTYTDTQVVPGERYYYQIRIKTPEPLYLDDPDVKKAGSGPYVHSLSNLEDLKQQATIIGINDIEQQLKVFPNPYSEATNIHYKLDQKQEVKIEVFSILGMKVAEIVNEQQIPGTYQYRFSAKSHGFAEGLYYLRFELNRNKVSIRKILEN